MGRHSGISQEKMAALGDYSTSGVFSETERLVLEYADAMTITPVAVPEALFVRLRARFDEPQLVEITANIAWENYRARFNHAFGIEAEGFSEGAFCALPVGKNQV